MIRNLYSKYFQKSRSFLYPVLGIKKGSHYSPSDTYISMEGLIDPVDMKLICRFKDDGSTGFQNFRTNMLLGNPLFHQVISVQDDDFYIFTFENFDEDWMNFLTGSYSKLTNVVKRAIKMYYGENSPEYDYIDSYLYPEKYFDVYAKLLDVNIQVLKETGELCSPYDPEKEVLKIPVEHLENLKSSLIL